MAFLTLSIVFILPTYLFVTSFTKTKQSSMDKELLDVIIESIGAYSRYFILFIENLSRSDYIHDVIVRTDRISLQLGLIVFQAILLIEIKMTDTLATNVKASFDERINWWAPDSDVSTCCSFNCAHVFENQTGLFAHFATLYIKKGNRNCVKRVMNVIRRI